MIGAGTIDRGRATRRAYVRPALSPGTWDAPSGLRRGDSYTRRGPCPEADPASSSRRRRRASASARTGERTLMVPFKPGERAPVSESIGRAPAAPARPRPRCDFAPFDGDGLGGRRATRACAAPSSTSTKVMERSQYERTWELVEAAQARARHTRWTTSAPSTSTCTEPEFRYVERPPQPRRRRRAAGLLHQRVARGLLPALRGRDGADAADGRASRRGWRPASRPGGYSERHKAWIVRDTDAHAWVEVWFDEYGWVTFDPTPAATPARSQVARAGRRRRRSARRASRPRPAQRRRPTTATNPTSVRPELQARPERRRRRGADAEGSGSAWLRWFGRRRAGSSRAGARDGALHPPPARRDADGPRDRRGRGRDAPRRAPGHDRHDAVRSSSAGSARTRRRSRRICGRWPSGRYAAGLGAAVARRAARAAARAGAGPRVRRARARAVGAAAAVRAARARRGSRVFEVETASAASRRTGGIERVWVA